uniref:Uncharacterized protein n=1 Tax=Parascaris equorum TaxID=6256 RepID=A0A914RWH1_PAREQ
MNDETESAHPEDNRSASEENPLRNRFEIGVDESMFCSEERSEENISCASDGCKQQVNNNGENRQEKGCDIAKGHEDIEVEQQNDSVLETEHEITAVSTVVLHSTDFLFLNDSLLVRFFARCLSTLIQPGTQFERGFPCGADILFCWPITSAGTFCEHSLNRIVEWKVRNPA